MADRSLISAGLLCIGEIASLQGQLAYATELLSASQSMQEAIGGVRNRVATKQYEESLDRVRQGLSPEAFQRAWDQGRLRPIEQIAISALEGAQPVAR